MRDNQTDMADCMNQKKEIVNLSSKAENLKLYPPFEAVRELDPE